MRECSRCSLLIVLGVRKWLVAGKIVRRSKPPFWMAHNYLIVRDDKV